MSAIRQLLAAGALVAAASAPAYAVDIVNGGFETGDFSGWTQGGNTSATGVVDSSFPFPIFAGSYSAAFGPVGSVGTLSQTLAVVPGETYTVSFYLNNQGGAPSSFSVQLGTSTFSLPNDFLAFPYSRFSVTTVATGPTLGLTFSFQQDPSFWLLDDVTVSGPVPEAGTLGMLLAGLGVVALLARRRQAAAA